MRKLIVTEWMSLDGVNDAATMAEWFNPYHSDSRALSIQDTINSAEIFLYGKNTYQMLYPYWSAMKNNEMGVAEKLNKARKYVVSTSMVDALWQNSAIIKTGIVKEITDLKKNGDGIILVQGSMTLVKTLLAAGLVDELKLLIHPYIVGAAGGTLFHGINNALTLTGLQQLDKGVIQALYQPKRTI